MIFIWKTTKTWHDQSRFGVDVTGEWIVWEDDYALQGRKFASKYFSDLYRNCYKLHIVISDVVTQVQRSPFGCMTCLSFHSGAVKTPKS